MSGGRLPKRIMSGIFEGSAERMGWEGERGDRLRTERHLTLVVCVIIHTHRRSAERTGWEGERVDRLCTERHPGVWYNGGLENNGVKG